MQKQRVVAWLSQHNFPHGIVSFCDGLVHDPLRHKANFLKSLTEVRVGVGEGTVSVLNKEQKRQMLTTRYYFKNVPICLEEARIENFSSSFLRFQAHMKIFAGYGSTKDISVYTSIGLPSSQIYIVGRPSKKMQHQCQVSLSANDPVNSLFSHKKKKLK